MQREEWSDALARAIDEAFLETERMEFGDAL